MNGENDIITVFIVAASPIVRAGLESVLQTEEKFIVAGGAAEISAAPAVFSDRRTIDVLLVNVERQNEFVALTEFFGGEEADEETNLPFVVALLSPDLLESSGQQALGLLQNGARAVLPHDASAGEIHAAILAAANDLIVATPEILETLFSSTAFDARLPNVNTDLPEIQIENLTRREQEVLELLVEGESNKIIAHRLKISEHTVKFHVASIFGKLGVNTRTEAATIALRRGLILL